MVAEAEPLPGMPETTAWSDLSPQRRTKVARRFAHKIVAVDNGCEIFTGGVSSPDGYGRVSVTINSVERIFRAHRLACLLAGVDLPPGSVVEHRCNEPLCVRVDPHHVTVSTQAANLAWAVTCSRAAGPRMVVGSHQRAERSRHVRALALAGWDQHTYELIVARHGAQQCPDEDQLGLW